uniref:Oocyte secreted protein 1 n=1 Tax=Piliocolobus tephrosceles TaxID=591936 RepID=A0A8C9I1E9_9PRIM
MKTILGLKALFFLHSLIWTCAGDWSAIQVHCTQFWFFARIKPTIFYNLYTNPDEVFLGDGCPVTHVLPNVYYEFFYHPHDCGIVTQPLREVLLLKTKIKYISRDSTVRCEMPLSCVVRNQHPLLNAVETRDGETHNVNEWEIEVRIHIANEDTSNFCNTILVLKGKVIFRSLLIFISRTLPRGG